MTRKRSWRGRSTEAAARQDSLYLLELKRQKHGVEPRGFKFQSKTYPINCQKCGVHVEGKTSTQKYCLECRAIVEDERKQKASPIISDVTLDLPEGRIRVIIKRVKEALDGSESE